MTIRPPDPMPPGLVRIAVWLGAEPAYSGLFEAAALDAVLGDVERACPDWQLERRRHDRHAHGMMRNLVLLMAGDRPSAGRGSAVVKAAVWLAINNPDGGSRRPLEAALAAHGRATLFVRIDGAGEIWEFAVADEPQRPASSRGPAPAGQRRAKPQTIH